MRAKIWSFFGASEVAKDQFGNRYFDKNGRRFVIYKGLAEPSKIPPIYHAWLHGNLEDDDLKLDENKNNTLTHLPNLSGTVFAYRPNGYGGYKRSKARGDYIAWKPQN